MFLDIVSPNPLDFLEPGAVALLIAYLFISIAAIVTGFMTGRVVPKFIYDKAVDRGDKAVEVVERLTQAVEDLTKEVRFKGGK